MIRSRTQAIRRDWFIVPLSMLMLMTIIAGLLAGCNTTAGAGEDLQAAGHGIEHSADKNKSY